MSFPQVAGRADSQDGSDVTNHTVDLPGSISSGDMLLALFCCDGNETVTWPGTWTVIFDDVTDSSAATFNIAYLEATGSEGASITVTTGNGQQSAHTVYRITGARQASVQAPEVSSAEPGTSNQPTPPSLTPSGGERDYLWFAVAGMDDDNAGLLVNPTSYTDGVLVTSNTGTGTCSVVSARRELTASEEDPGNIVMADADPWAACTVSIPNVAQDVTLAATVTGTPSLSTQARRFISFAASVTGLPVVSALFTQPPDPFTGAGGLGILDGVSRWRRRRGQWRRRR